MGSRVQWACDPLASFPSAAEKQSITLGEVASLVAQTVKHLPVMRETQVLSLGWEDPLEKEISTHSSILGWTEKSHGQRSLEDYSQWGH